MKNFYSRATIAEEAKLLFMLADAAAEMGRLTNPESKAHWLDAKKRVEKKGYEPETELLFTLLTEIDAAGGLKGTWIQSRWHTVKKRIDEAPRRKAPRGPDS